MKLITLSGGLGNQMFQFALYLQLRATGQSVFLYKNKIMRHRDHGGYDLERLFGVESRCGGLWLTRLLLCPFWGTLLKHLLFPCKLRERKLYDYSAYAERLMNPSRLGVHLVGYWQSERFFREVQAEVRRVFAFDEAMVSGRNRSLAAGMRQENAVSLHVRRGDYVTTGFSWMYGDICTTDYYRRAVEYMAGRVVHPVYYVFSDDPEWVRTHLPLPEGAVTVDWNNGRDSWQDLYLMSCCRHHIVANSSFSWWGAWLGTQADTCVVAPAQWVHHMEAPDAAPSSWVRL